MSQVFKIEQWSIVPGGTSIRPPYHSTDLDAAVSYSLEDVAAAILCIPGVERVRGPGPDWSSWRARWRSGNAVIDVEMTTWDAPDGGLGWGGSSVSGSADSSALARFYSQLHHLLPCTWLHNDNCELHTAETFLATTRTG